LSGAALTWFCFSATSTAANGRYSAPSTAANFSTAVAAVATKVNISAGSSDGRHGVE